MTLSFGKMSGAPQRTKDRKFALDLTNRKVLMTQVEVIHPVYRRFLLALSGPH
jgi:hypothetical protein